MMGAPRSLARPFASRARERWSHFLHEDEDGGTMTLEFILWLPVFMLIAALIFDLAFLFMAQTRLHDVAAYATRSWAVGTMSLTEAQSYARDADILLSARPTSTEVISGGALTMTLSLSAAKVTPFGILHFLGTDNIVSEATQAREGV